MNIEDLNYIKDLILNESNLDINLINDNTKIKDLDIDSLAILGVCSDLEDKYNISLIKTAKDLQELNIKEKTMGEFIIYVQNKIENEKK